MHAGGRVIQGRYRNSKELFRLVAGSGCPRGSGERVRACTPTIHRACFNRRRAAFCPSIREPTTVRTIPRKLIYLKYFTSNRYLAAIKLKRDREKQREEREREKVKEKGDGQ